MKAAALAVGINAYKYNAGAALRGCVSDMQTMKKYFLSLGVPATAITSLQNEAATKHAIIMEWKRLVAAACEGEIDYIFISHSSHGSNIKSEVEFDGLDEVLCCYDTKACWDGEWERDTVIADDELSALFSLLPPSVGVELWFDTCYSGGMTRRFVPHTQRKYMPPPERQGDVQVNSTQRMLGRPLTHPGLVLWAACGEGQEGEDTYIGGHWVGAFTYAWKQVALPGMTRSAISRALKVWMRENGYYQVPRVLCTTMLALSGVGK